MMRLGIVGTPVLVRQETESYDSPRFYWDSREESQSLSDGSRKVCLGTAVFPASVLAAPLAALPRFVFPAPVYILAACAPSPPTRQGGAKLVLIR